MAFAGWLTVGIQADDSKFDKQMAKLDSDIQKKEQKKAVIEVELEKYDEQTQKLNDLKNKKKELEEQLATAEAARTPSERFGKDSEELQNLRSQVASVSSELEQQSIAHEKNASKIDRQAEKYNELNDEISESKAKIESINLQKQQSQVQELKNSFNNVGKSLEGSVKSIGKMVVGIFGVRSAYNMLKQASSTLAQYDSQYAANLEYIRWALAQAVAPILRYIVQIVGTILNYVIQIIQSISPLFKNIDLSAKGFSKMKSGASGVAKAAKEINKQLAGFDEANILSDQSSTAGGGATGGGGAAPSIDLSGVQGEVPQWLQWIIDHKDTILAVLAGVGTAIAAIKLGIAGIQALGIGVAITGIVMAISGLISYLKDPSFENFGKIITGIGLAVAGVAIAVGAWPVAIAGALIAIWGVIISKWDKIKGFVQEKLDYLKGLLDSEELKQWAEDNLGPIAEPFLDVTQRGYDMIKRLFEYIDKEIQAAKKVFDGIILFIKGIKDKDWDEIWQGFGQIVEGVWEGIKAQAELVWNWIVDLVRSVVDILQIIITKIVDWIVTGVKWLFNKVIVEPIEQAKESTRKANEWIAEKFNDIKTKIVDKVNDIKTKFTELWDNFKNKATDAWEKVKGVFSKIGDFFGNIWNTIKSKFTDIGQKIGESISGAFKNAINAVLKTAETVLNAPIKAINGLIGTVNNLPGINLGKLNTFSLPRLATGAIINMPNRGVNIGGAIAGESGREGILPLTDTRAMQQLGEEIGKWITINANITNNMNGRVISRQLQKIQNERNFAFNS